MPTITLVRSDEDGRLAGLSEKDRRAWARFLKRVRDLGRSCITFEWREPRSGPYHRFCFAAWNKVFEAQERFEDFEAFFCWVKVGGGHCEFLPHPEKGLIAVPKSIAWAKLDEMEFRPIADSMFAFLRSEHARRTIWPHLTETESWEMIETILEGFE